MMIYTGLANLPLLISVKKLNLGCGFDIRDGYLNVDLNDFHSPDVVADVSNLEGFPDAFYDEILAQDILEHMTRDLSKAAFTEWVRLLSPTGILKVRIPSLLGMFSLFARDAWTAEAHSQIVHLMYGTQAYNGDYHLAGFTPPILLEMAENAGVMVSSAVLKDDWLFDLEFVHRSEPTDEQFVHQLYFEVLGRCADTEGYASHLSALKSGRTREELRNIFVTCDESKIAR